MLKQAKSSEKFSNQALTKKWFKEHLLLNVGYVPKIFGYRDEDVLQLLNGRLREWTSGVEYYFGLTLRGVEKRVDDFPHELTDARHITVLHAPFVKEPYPSYVKNSYGFYNTLRVKVLTRADPDPLIRLQRAIVLASVIGAPKIVIHASDIFLTQNPRALLQKLNSVSKKKGVMLCIENNRRTLEEQRRDKSEWRLALDPIELIRYFRKNELDNCYLTIDTAHMAASGYTVGEMWENLKQFLKGEINGAIQHFHFVDYDPKTGFDALPPGSGIIGTSTFKAIISDLYALRYAGTMSFEVAPIHYHRQKPRLLFETLARMLSPFPHNLKKEESYLLRIIESLIK